MNIEYIPSLIHEAMHLFDYLLNPKYRRTLERTAEKDVKTKVTELYKKNYYNNSDAYIYPNIIRILKTFCNTLKTLKSEPTKNKILMLSYIKEAIEFELKGYNLNKEYADFLKKNNKQYFLSDIGCFYKEYMFEEKLKLVQMMLKYIIKKEHLINSIKQSVKCFE